MTTDGPHAISAETTAVTGMTVQPTSMVRAVGPVG
jgi:hypothetical protein